MIVKVLRLLKGHSVVPELMDNFTKSGLVHRLISCSTYFIPKETRHSPDLKDASYYIVDSLSEINLKTYGILADLFTLFLQASFGYGITSYDLLLKDIDPTYINMLKDTSNSLKFENPKKLEFFFNNIIECLSCLFVIRKLNG